jgi:hypothetical protein
MASEVLVGLLAAMTVPSGSKSTKPTESKAEFCKGTKYPPAMARTGANGPNTNHDNPMQILEIMIAECLGFGVLIFFSIGWIGNLVGR